MFIYLKTHRHMYEKYAPFIKNCLKDDNQDE